MILNYGQLKETLKFTKGMAFKSGKKLETFRKKIKTLDVQLKKGQGLVSNADIESERMIIAAIKKKYPDHEILAEEQAFIEFGGKKKAYSHFKEKEWLWIIDPLDGTNNFLSGLDYYAVCICLAHFGEPYMGVVYNPVSGACFSAIKGRGARLENLHNKTQRSTTLKAKQNIKNLKEGLLATGFATEKGKAFDQEFRLFKKIMSECRGVRRMGSAALDLCHVGQGLFDGFWERGLAPWDTAAAGLICGEAGHILSQYNGAAFNPFDETIVCAPKSIHKALIKNLK